MRKWNPVYRVTVYYRENDEVKQTSITLPLTCKATITRSVLAESVTADIQIYGLSENTREKIYQPPYKTYGQERKVVTIEAGYGDYNSMYLLFKGVILQAYSTKQGGATDVITTIQAQALDLFTSQSSHQFAAGTSFRDIYTTLAADFPNCVIGNTGSLSGTIKTPTTFDGNTYEQINKLTGGNTFIDNGVVNTLMNNECIDIPVPVITDKNALLETPQRSDVNLNIKILFEPSLIVGQLLEIESGIAPEFNGQYKVLGFTHDLLFSASQDGQRTTSVELWAGRLLEATPLAITGEKTEQKFSKVKGTKVTPVDESQADVNWSSPLKSFHINSGYGWRIHPTKHTKLFHYGIDLRAALNTQVSAVASGKVTVAGKNGGYGNYLQIDHGGGLQSYYGHLNKILVPFGAQVSKGQIIALSGNTGTSSGPHLHLGALKNGQQINPLNYLKN